MSSLPIPEPAGKLSPRTSSGEAKTAADARAMRYECTENLAAIEALSTKWDILLERSFCNRAFSCSTWFLAMCRHIPTISPMLFTAWRDRELAAVLPMALDSETGIAGFASPLSDYNDMIAAAEDLSSHSGLLAFALATAGDRRVLLTDVRPDSSCVRAATELAARDGIPVFYDQCRICLSVNLSGTFDEYVMARSQPFRKGLRRIRRQANEHKLEVRHLDPATFKANEVGEVFLSLNLGRFGERSRFDTPASRGIVDDLLPALFLQRRMDVFVLIEAGRVVSLDLCMRGCKTLCTWNGGFHMEAAQWSPGRLLMAAEIEHAFAAGFEEFDMLRGTHPYKTSWANGSRKTGHLHFGEGKTTEV